MALEYPDIITARSLLSAGPMQAILEPSNAPIVGRVNAGQVLNKVYGGDQDYFYAQSPRYLATQVSKTDKNRIILRQITGNGDPVCPLDVRFAEHVTMLGMNIQSSELEGVDHNPQELFKALSVSEGYWAFFTRSSEILTSNSNNRDKSF